MRRSNDNEVKLIKPFKPYRWVGIDKYTWRRAEAAQGSQENEAMH